MRRAILLIAGCGALVVPSGAAGAAPAGDGAVAHSPTPSAPCSPPGDPLYGVVRGAGGRIFARIAPRTLRARPEPQIALPDGVYGSSWSFSPTCDAVALGAQRGRILLVDLERGRRMGMLALGGRSLVTLVAWTRPERLLAIAGSFEAPRVLTVAVPEGRVVASRRLGGRPWVMEPTPHGIVVLTAPGDRIGSATLVLADPDGGLSRIPLRRIRAGLGEVGPSRLARQIIPGVAVDEAAGRAYVVAANEPLVADIDLATGAVNYHELRGTGASAGAAPTAAKGLGYGAYRMARWIGDGTLAVSGEVIRTVRDRRRSARGGRTLIRIEPYGLRLVRTADWTETTLNPLLQSFRLAGDVLLGMNAHPASLGGARPTGLVAYGPDGRRRFTRFRGHGRVWLRDVAWPYAYLREIHPRRTLVVDLRTGRTVGETGSRRPPVLLVR